MGKITAAVATLIGYLLAGIYNVLYNIFGSIGITYGMSIILLTIIIRIAMYPLFAKQTKSMANMGSLQEKIKELQKKYGDDKETYNQKVAELYKEEGVNPSAGCLPMLIQLPIIWGLFALLRNPMNYVDSISIIDSTTLLMGIHESFFWIHDLTQPDSWILPIGAAITTYINFSQSQNQQSGNAQSGGAMMSSMKYFYPVIILWMGRSFPAGLAIYWFVSQFVQIFINRHLNKLRREIREGKYGKKESKKKGKENKGK